MLDDTPQSQQMKDDETKVAQAIKASMAEGARPAFDEKDIEDLGILIRLTVKFHHFLTSQGRWPVFPDDPFHNMTYALDPIFWHADAFLRVTHLYGVLVGATLASTIDWSASTAPSLKDRFLSKYEEFLAEANFENKCRLLLDLFKLQIVFAGMFYDCYP